MTIAIIIFCTLGFLFTTFSSIMKKNLKVVNNDLLGTVTKVHIKNEVIDNKVRHLYEIEVNDIIYKIKTHTDFSGIIKTGAIARLLTMQSGKKFINFDNDEKSFYVYNYQDLEKSKHV